ncbi:MAG TPA: hypothetical protein VGB17_11635 [Pyrinomonadaceae bacterium]|jgi:hypothetical protein
MTDDELQLKAQSSLQEFDDARERPGSDPIELGRKAISALDTFIAYWSEKPYMLEAEVDSAEGGHHDLKEYAERQVEWATIEKERVRKLIASPEEQGGESV